MRPGISDERLAELLASVREALRRCDAQPHESYVVCGVLVVSLEPVVEAELKAEELS